MIICKFSHAKSVVEYSTTDEAIKGLENLECAAYSNELAEEIYTVKCDIIAAVMEDDYESYADADGEGNWIFER